MDTKVAKVLDLSGNVVDKKVETNRSISYENKGNLLDNVYVPQIFRRDIPLQVQDRLLDVGSNET